MEQFRYTGELKLFEHAANWKRYWLQQVRPYLGRTVLEVGAGIGTNTRLMASSDQQQWICLEPDLALGEAMRQVELPATCRIVHGTIADLPASEQFETIVYIDVLEHIEDDGAEIAAAQERLLPGGYIVVLAPAHQFLYSPFDKKVGHHRRYDRQTLLACTASGLDVVKCIYLDSVGLIVSAANRFFLKADTPTVAQVKLWDRIIVPVSRYVDGLLRWRVGKSIFAVWTKPH